jgi:hypothetical protein
MTGITAWTFVALGEAQEKDKATLGGFSLLDENCHTAF